MSSGVILDRVWSMIDPERQGYVYAKDIPEIISLINRDLPTNLTTSSNDKVIQSWINKDPMKRVTKDGFLEVFSTLLGTSFDTAVQIALSWEIETPSQRGTGLFGSYRKPRNNETASLAEQVESLQKEVQDWKEKYSFLEREFQFFISQEKSPQLIDNTKHEFIISELNRKLVEQAKDITNLQNQLDYGIAEVTSKSAFVGRGVLRKVYSFILSRLVWGMAVMFMIWYLFGIISLRFSTTGDESPGFVRQESWWERNSILSRVQWYYRDTMESNFDKNVSEVLQNYNSVFGIN